MSKGMQILLSLILVAAPSYVPADMAVKEGKKDHKPAVVTRTEQGTIVMAGMSLTKGAPRDAVMHNLSGSYRLHQMKSSDGAEDSWLITEKDNADDYLGVVSFADGRVRRVARFRKWTQDQDSVELAQRLCDLVEQLTGQRRRESRGHRENQRQRQVHRARH